MHFQPLEDIAENLEESGTHHPNVALFNRLLGAAPSPTGFMGGALRRTSAQLQRLRHFPGNDLCNSDDDDNESCKMGGSLPSGLGQETQSTLCSAREEKSTRTPLLEVEFGVEQEKRDEEHRRGLKGKAEFTQGEAQGPVSLLPPPPPPASSSPAFHPAAHSSLEHCSSQPAINQHRAPPVIPKPPSRGHKMCFLTVPSYEPQRCRSASMGSELSGS